MPRIRTRRARRPALEGLEGRDLMAAGLTPFAEVGVANATQQVRLQVNAADFTLARGKLWLRLDDTVGGPVLGEVDRLVTTPRGAVVPVRAPSYTLPGNQELVAVRPGTYVLNLRGTNSGLGSATVNVSLAGDALGTYRVDTSSLLAVRNSLGVRAGAPGYNPAADVFNDGRITYRDLLLTRANLGASTSLRPLGPLSVSVTSTAINAFDFRRTITIDAAAGTQLQVGKAGGPAVLTEAVGPTGVLKLDAGAITAEPEPFTVQVRAGNAFGSQAVVTRAVPAAQTEGTGYLFKQDASFNPKNAPNDPTANLPAAVDLRTTGDAPAIYNQGVLNSCVANALAYDYRYIATKEKLATAVDPSRLYIYYNARAQKGAAIQDGGSNDTAMVHAMETTGVAPESAWPYVVAAVNVAPPASAYAAAEGHKVHTAYSLNGSDLAMLKASLAAGDPFVFGFETFAGLDTPSTQKTGAIPLPAPGEKADGGHAVVAVGYDDARGVFLIANSWGTANGIQGYYTIPYAYVTNPKLSDGFYSIRAVS